MPQRLSTWLRTPLAERNKALVGTTALLILALIIFIALQISSGGIGKRTIHAEFAQAAGISSGDAVNVAGVQVGTVTKTALAGKLVRVDMQVDDTVDLGPSSRAAIKLTTLLGSRYIDLRPAGKGTLPDATIRLSHTEVPYTLQEVLQDATVTFEQVDADDIAKSMTTLAHQLDDTPALIPQVLTNVQNLSTILADRRSQIGDLLTGTEQLTTVVQNQQKNLGELVTSGDKLLRALLQRQHTITRLLDATTEVVGQLRTIVVDDNSGVQALITNLNGLLTTLQRNDALLRNTMEILPVPLRNFTNTTGTGNEVDFSSVAGPFIDSWMCAVSKQAQVRNLPPYFKDCQ
ncbi:MCE family protein [Gordonia sp. (in: high G+C Gram-positive bacteria)]|jgi:virulence factor Mce-like protein|uniref:MCE family protein n=1 Tax=Gordonia sp. (in: high G+C Gram-positive bacteria) TaxID=84139 RepID=UPI001D8B97A5|nr:MCE family protein [Gordonia sp. (in: high G+C Gram-positive bacteria)]MCB1296971.1 MCE family protein [Gordonia sp. (in: high G+C Gram-positive bacteria)]HMS76496.1 MCE family protein [Gordonia sp. (in: high G+C Gram-positive bacteria)]HQV18284.1 MCE family protein [Gordonia sp. (in: high G+C Gram-positive bacteria)]